MEVVPVAKPVRYIKIIAHPQPHLDELVAMFLLRDYGPRFYRGIDYAKLEFIRPEDVLGSRTPEELEAEGILLIGVGGGRFDEHGAAGEAKTLGKSAASLVAEAIQCSHRQELEG